MRDRFERALADATAAPAEERREQLERALELWRGPALAEFAFDDFAQAEIRRLEELRLVALEERIDADLELGRHGDVDRRARGARRRASAPRDASAGSSCSRCTVRAGRPRPWTSYQDARARFVDELGIEPGPELKRLQAEILRHEAGIAAPRRAPATRRGGRDRERAPRGPRRAGHRPRRRRRPRRAPRERVRRAGRPARRPRARLAVRRDDAGLRPALRRAAHAASRRPSSPARCIASSPRLPALLRERGAPHQLIVTTNYDLALERAFEEAGEELDIVAYVATGPHRGRFWHRPPGEPPRPIDVPNTYATELSLERRTILLKLHGAVDPLPEREWESFVITEDDYIDYLGRSELHRGRPGRPRSASCGGATSSSSATRWPTGTSA